MMEEVIIDGQSFSSFASVAEADSLLISSLNHQAWEDLSTDDKGRMLVAATNYLNSLSWKETCFPLSDSESIKTATILIAEYLALGNTSIIGLSPQEQAVKTYKAGSVELTYQSSPWWIASNKNSFYNIPPQILNLIKGCLAGYGNGVGGARSFGTCGEPGASVYERDYDLINN